MLLQNCLAYIRVEGGSISAISAMFNNCQLPVVKDYLRGRSGYKDIHKVGHKEASKEASKEVSKEVSKVSKNDKNDKNDKDDNRV